MTTTLREAVREEVQNGLIWVTLFAIGWTLVSVSVDLAILGGGLVERAIIIAVLSLASGLVFVLPLLGVRLVTGEDLSALRPGGPLFRLTVGGVLGGFITLYFVLAWGVSSLVLPLYGAFVAIIVWKTGLRRVGE